jgi:hypothetical protein
MEDSRETQPQEGFEPEDSEREAFQALDEITFQPEAELESGGNLEGAEAIEAAFVELLDPNVEDLGFSSVPHEVEEDEEYRILVKFPWIGEGDADDQETAWAQVATFMTDGDGAWYLPEVEDEVVADTDDQALRSDDLQPATTDDQAPRSDDIQPAAPDDGGDEGEERD